MKSFAKFFIVLASLTALVRAEPVLHTSPNGKQYLVEGDRKFNWFEAQHKCQQQNMQLVEIYSQEQQTEMEAVLKPLYPNSIDLWLGANDEYSSSTDFKRPMYWSTSGKLMDFSIWTSNNPNNQGSSEHCIHIWRAEKTFAWNDIGCTSKMGYICESNHVADEKCQELAAKKNEISAILSNGQELFSHYQNNLSESLNSGLQTVEDVDKNVAAAVLMAQGSLVEQITSLLAQNKDYITSVLGQRQNTPTTRSDIVKMSVDGATSMFSVTLQDGKNQIENVLQCGAPLPQ